jgi:hypothetical protein
VLRRIFGTYSEGVAGGCGKVYNMEVLELYSTSNIIPMIQSMRIRWAGHVACMVENKNVRVLVGEDEGKRRL